MMGRLTQQLLDKGLQLGFSHIAVIPAGPARKLDAYLDWIQQGCHGEMHYMARPDRVQRRQDLDVVLPGVRSIITAAMNYSPPPIPAEIADDPSRGRISNYAWGVDYHDVVGKRLDTLSQWLAERVGDHYAAKIYVDTGAILERDHAETGGLGFTGKNTMLIAPKGGSYKFLGQILTTVLLEPGSTGPADMPSCGSCTRCIDACPTSAFPKSYVLDARRCISYLTIEFKGWIPRELRPLMGNWIYGCDVCQEVCPFNRFSQTTNEEAFLPEDWNRAAPPLLDILAVNQTTFEARFAGTPIRRIGRDRLIRNACVAAANWGSEAAVPILCELLEDPNPLIRGHAAWALGTIGGQRALLELIIHSKREQDQRVSFEISAAI